MKFSYTIITFLFIGIISNAQYTKLFDFAGGPNGSVPYGSLILDGTFLYATTFSGGTHNLGNIFKIKSDGTGYVDLFDFAHDTMQGYYPYCSLISDGTFLYGMTRKGGPGDTINGSGGDGVLFKIKLNGMGDTTLIKFSCLANGCYPNGSLISDGTFLYGMTTQSGIGYGTIFKIKSDGTGYSKLHHFLGPGIDGQTPWGDLFYDGAFLYGMAVAGGTNNLGTIFKIKPDGTGFSKLLDFSGTANGSTPVGSLVSDGTYLYGMTSDGGTNNMGVIFKIKPDGSGYVNLLDFAGTANGKWPEGSFIFDGTFLYGMTEWGGTNNLGTLFKIKPNGTGFAKLLDFAGTTNGSYPRSSLISDGTFLYGMTKQGGINNLGTVFKYKYCSAITNSVTIIPPTCGNNNGSASVTPSGGIGNYTYLWSNGNTTSLIIGLTGQPTDTLLVTITDSLGCWHKDTAIVTCTTGIAENNSETVFTISPNPFSSSTTFQTINFFSTTTLIVYNSFGQIVRQIDNLTGQKSIFHRSNLPSGLYFIRLMQDNKTIATHKLIITDN